VSRIPEYPDADLAWVAADFAGQVGVFITAGIAPIALSALQAEAGSVSALEELILLLPKRCGASQAGAEPWPKTVVALAERGFFLYDWQDIHKAASAKTKMYELMYRPLHPALVDEFEGPLAAALNQTRIPGVKFGEQSKFDIQLLCPCLPCPWLES